MDGVPGENIMEQDIFCILQDKQKLCIFAGAGASIMPPTRLPSFSMLNHSIIESICKMNHIDEDIRRKLCDIKTKPEQLLQLIWDYTDGQFNPVEGFQNVPTNQNHAAIARLAAEGVPCIITTNFDSCIETELNAQGVRYSFYSETKSNPDMDRQLINDLKIGQCVLWKPHGDCRNASSLCYTKKKVAQLRHSIFLTKVLSYIVCNYNILFIGYSGYDDDIFPALYAAMKDSENQIIWNTHSAPHEDTPVTLLQNTYPDQVHLLTGDMLPLLEEILQLKDIFPLSGQCISNDWAEQIYWGISRFPRSLSLSIIAKYLSIHGSWASAETLWNQGLTYDKENLRNMDKLRFQLNLNQISMKTAYEEAIRHSYFQIAEIALGNMIAQAKRAKQFDLCSAYLSEYRKLCDNPCCSEFFSLGIYHYRMVDVLCEKYGEKDGIHKINEYFDEAYKWLSVEGNISEIGSLVDMYFGYVATKKNISDSSVSRVIKIYHEVAPYNETTMLAGLCYTIANMAIKAQDTFDTAKEFNKRSMEYLEIGHRQEIYLDDQYYLLAGCIFHQRSLLEDNVENCKKALFYFQKLPDGYDRWNFECATYTNLACVYQLSDYKLCQKYGETAISIARKCNNIRQEAHALVYMAVADAATYRKRQATARFKTARAIHVQIGEMTEEIDSLMKKYGLR